MSSGPLYIDSKVVAARIGWRTERLQRMWRKLGIARKRGKSVVTTFDLLAEAFPEQAEDFAEWLARDT